MTALLPRLPRDNFITRYLSDTAKEFIPRKIKRMIYVSTILGLILKSEDIDNNLIERLNTTLEISNRDKNLESGVCIKALVWRHIDTNIIRLSTRKLSIYHLHAINLSDDERREFGYFFSKNCPDWLKYGSRELMTYDASQILVQLSEHQKEQNKKSEEKEAA